MWIFILAVAVICAFLNDNVKATRDLQQQLWDKEISERPRSYRDYECEPEPRPVKRLTHSDICKLPGCRGMHRSHV